MNLKALVQLGVLAREWARTYAAVYDELRRTGVPDSRARDDARWAAHHALFRSGVEDEDTAEEPWGP